MKFLNRAMRGCLGMVLLGLLGACGGSGDPAPAAAVPDGVTPDVAVPGPVIPVVVPPEVAVPVQTAGCSDP